MTYLKRISMDEWRRLIGPTAYARGVSACLENARALIEDSLVLLESGRTARAVALAILALEEGDKIKRVFRIAFLTNPVAIKREWAKFRDHKPKLSSSLSLLTHGGFSIVSDKVARKKTLPLGGEWIADLPRLTERLKERCIYVTRLQDGTWTVPSKVVSRLTAELVIAVILFLFSTTTALVLGTEMLVGGQLEESPGFERPDLTQATPRAKRWLRWRLGNAGQLWGKRELSRQMQWASKAAERSRRLNCSAKRVQRTPRATRPT